MQMRVAYIDAFAGCGGDMLLGALIDAGYPEESLRAGLAGLAVGGYEVEVSREVVRGISAVRLRVRVTEAQPHRGLSALLRILEESSLPPGVVERSRRAFRRLVEAEAGIHGVSPEEVHLHEVGAVDAIVDIVGVFLAVEGMGIDSVVCSPLPLGRGFVECAHGRLPLPAPATVALLRGAPVRGVDLEGETVTPTGALLLTELAERFGGVPSMVLRGVGHGAGSRTWPDRPNLVRVLIGEHGEHVSQVCGALVLETNIDDMTAEELGYLAERLREAGALDVSLIPVLMKKGRPGTLVHVICGAERQGALEALLLAESSTAGVRVYEVRRRVLPREIVEVGTRFGAIPVKVLRLPDGSCKAAPEYEACRARALEHGVPLRDVFAAAEGAARTALATDPGGE
jgi:hypothetical protein